MQTTWMNIIYLAITNIFASTNGPVCRGFSFSARFSFSSLNQWSFIHLALGTVTLNTRGCSEHEIKQFYSHRQWKERRTVYRISIENETPSSAVNGREYHRVHRKSSMSFLKEWMCFMSRGKHRWQARASLWKTCP